jgi:hypothetical protein
MFVFYDFQAECRGVARRSTKRADIPNFLN